MDDSKIVELYWDRSENAIEETQKKYGRYCYYIAYGILSDAQDAEECVNDTYNSSWNSIPPKKPTNLRGFLGSVTRNIALDRYDYNNAKKRSGKLETAIEEFGEILPNGENDAVDELALRELVNGFLSSLDKKSRIVFMQRYWYVCSIKEISVSMHMSENSVKVSLHRTRNKFREYLKKESIFI